MMGGLTCIHSKGALAVALACALMVGVLFCTADAQGTTNLARNKTVTCTPEDVTSLGARFNLTFPILAQTHGVTESPNATQWYYISRPLVTGQPNVFVEIDLETVHNIGRMVITFFSNNLPRQFRITVRDPADGVDRPITGVTAGIVGSNGTITSPTLTAAKAMDFAAYGRGRYVRLEVLNFETSAANKLGLADWEIYEGTWAPPPPSPPPPSPRPPPPGPTPCGDCPAGQILNNTSAFIPFCFCVDCPTTCPVGQVYRGFGFGCQCATCSPCQAGFGLSNSTTQCHCVECTLDTCALGYKVNSSGLQCACDLCDSCGSGSGYVEGTRSPENQCGTCQVCPPCNATLVQDPLTDGYECKCVADSAAAPIGGFFGMGWVVQLMLALALANLAAGFMQA
eukprot:jgi/Mesvir1/361/Mv18349-RA.1